MTDETKSAAAPEARGPDAREREIHGLLNSDSFRSLRWTGDACGDECPPECPTCTYGADIAAALRAHPAGEREAQLLRAIATMAVPLEVLVADEAANGEHPHISPSLRESIRAGAIASRAAILAPPPEGTSDENE